MLLNGMLSNTSKTPNYYTICAKVCCYITCAETPQRHRRMLVDNTFKHHENTKVCLKMTSPPDDMPSNTSKASKIVAK